MKRKMRRLLAMLLAFTLTFSVASTDVLAAGLEAAQEEGVITTQAPEAETLSEESTDAPDEEAKEAQSEETTDAPDEEAKEAQSEETTEAPVEEAEEIQSEETTEAPEAEETQSEETTEAPVADAEETQGEESTERVGGVNPEETSESEEVTESREAVGETTIASEEVGGNFGLRSLRSSNSISISGAGFFEGFEGGSIPEGWRLETDTEGYNWGITSKNSYSGSHSAWLRYLWERDGETAWLITPAFDFSNVETQILRFYFRNDVGQDKFEELRVCYRVNGDEWQELFKTEAAYNDWTKQSIVIPEEAKKSNVEIGFKGVNHDGFGICLDDVAIFEPPQYYSVTYYANGGTGEMVDANGQYEFAQRVVVLDNNFTHPPKKCFTSWNTMADGSGTTYGPGANFAIVEDITLYAQWEDQITCLEEGFEDARIPKGWKQETDYNGFEWSITGYDSHSGYYSTVGMHAQGSEGASVWLVTPELNLSDVIGLPELRFWYLNGAGENAVDGFSVSYRVNGGAWQELFKTESANENWTQRILFLPEGAKQADVEIGFECVNHDGWGLLLDDVVLIDSGQSYAVTYHANGGTGTMTDAHGPYGVLDEATVLPNGFTMPSNQFFLFWNTKSDGSGTTYLPGDSFIIRENVTLYAQWKNQPVRLEESFEGDEIPEGWTLENGSKANKWELTYGTCHSGYQAVQGGSASADDQITWLITPMCNFSEVNGVSKLSFWYLNKGNQGKFAELTVCYRVSGGEWQELFKTNAAHDAWTRQTAYLPENAKSANVEIGFKCENTRECDAYLDDVVLEAVPFAQTYVITYEANGGTGTMADTNIPYADGTMALLLGNGFTAPPDKYFRSWNMEPDGSGERFYPGETIELTENVTLYAQWLEFVSDLNEGFEGDGFLESWYEYKDDQAEYWYYGEQNFHTIAHSGQQMMYVPYAYANESGSSWLISPMLDLSDAASNYLLSFWYSNPTASDMHSDLGAYYRINGGEWNLLFQTSGANEEWTQGMLVLPDEAMTKGVEIGFRAIQATFNVGVHLDDVSLQLTDEYYSVSLPKEVLGGSIKADRTYAEPGETINLTIKTYGVYELETLSVKQGGESVAIHREDAEAYTFVLPKGNVVVDVKFQIKKGIAFYEDFEGEDAPIGWTLVDADGDDKGWFVYDCSEYPTDVHGRQIAYSGTKLFTSASWENGALTPDNWAITPAIEVPKNALLSFCIRGQDPDKMGEKMAVYVGTSTNVANMTKVGGDYTADQKYKQYVLDFSNYEGQTIYIAFRHYNVSNEFRINLDDVLITGDLINGSQCSVTYDANNGSGATSKSTVIRGQATTISSCEFTAPGGQAFVGWNTKEDGTGITYWEGDYFEVKRDVTLYAQWMNITFYENFDSGSANGWTFVDGDGDGYGWNVVSKNHSEKWLDPVCYHSSPRSLSSASFFWDTKTLLEPENWAISPAIKIPQNAMLSYWIKGQELYKEEKSLSVYVGTSTDVASMKKLGSDVAPYGCYWRHYVDLSEYEGQTIYIAFLHHNVASLYWLNLDDVLVTGEDGNAITHSLTYDANNGSGMMTSKTYLNGKGATVLPCEFTPIAGMEFMGWNTKADGSGITYGQGDVILMEESITLYAQWVNASELITFLDEKFDGGTIPEGWSAVNSSEGYAWTIKGSSNYFAGVQFTAVEDYGKKAWLLTPLLDLSDVSGKAKISFTYQNGEYDGRTDEIGVCYRVDGGEWHALFVAKEATVNGVRQEVYLPDEAKAENIEIAFLTVCKFGGGVGVDNVSIVGIGELSPYYAVIYDANGGSGETTDSRSPYKVGKTVTILKNNFATPEGKMFIAWNTMADGSGTSYLAGDAFEIQNDVTLYAQWEDLPATVSEIEEGFEGGSLPSGWKLEGNHETYAWTVGTGDEETSPGAHSGEKNALITHVERNATAWIVSPWLDLTDGPNYVLRFWFVNRRNLIRTDSLKVCYRVLGGDWLELYQVNRNNSSWTMEEILLPEEARKAYVEIGFCATDDNGMGIGLDDVELKVSTDAFYHVDVEPASNGTVKADADDKRVGEVVTISATPAGGYKLAELNVTCGEQTVALTRRSDGLYEFVMPAGDVNVKARFLSESAVVSYELWVGGTQVTSANAGDVLGNGAASYDGITKILTLSKNVANENGDGISSNVNGLILKTTAPLTIRSGEEDALELLGPATIETNGLLTLAGLAENYGCGISAEAPVTIRNSEIAASGWWGIFGATSDAWTTIRNSSVTAEGTRSAASKIKLDGSFVASPMDVEFRENGFVYLPDGYMARNLVIVPSLKDENLAVSKKSLTLYDTIAIDFKVAKSAIEGKYHDPYLMVTQNGKEKKITEWEPSDDGTLMIFSYRVAPHNMRDVVTAVPHALNVDGADVMGPSMEYSVADYCYNMLSMEKYQTNEWAPFRRLLVDILRYGDAAQTYAGYKTAEPASWKLTRAQRAMGTDASVQMVYENVKDLNFATVSDENRRAEIVTAALYLEAAVNIQFKFTAQDLTGLKVVISDGEKVLDELTPDPSVVDENGRYYVTFDKLNAGQMRKTVYATVMQDSNAVSNTMQYSIESYAASQSVSEVENLPELLHAMMRYGDSAKKYATGR